MSYKNNKRSGFMIVLITMIVILPATLLAQKSPQNDNFFGSTSYTGIIVTFDGQTPSFTMEIKGLTTATNVKNDLKILESKGQNGFSNAVENQNLGYFALEGQVGQDLKYVTATKTASGTKIVAVFNRWIETFEFRSGLISTDYPFTYIELLIDNSGKITGTLNGAVKVEIDKENPGSLGFENFGILPAKLIGIQMSRKEL